MLSQMEASYYCSINSHGRESCAKAFVCSSNGFCPPKTHCLRLVKKYLLFCLEDGCLKNTPLFDVYLMEAAGHSTELTVNTKV